MNVRRPTEADAPAVTELTGATDSHFLGVPELNEQDLRWRWSELTLDRDAWLVELDDELAGYAALYSWGNAVVHGYVHPQHFGRGVGSRLVELTETEARSRKLDAIQNAVLAADDRAGELLRTRGYSELRHFYRMAIELEAPPAEPTWADGLRVSPVDYANEADAFHATLDEAFAEEFGHEPEQSIDWRARRERPGFDPAVWFVVKEDNEVVAAVLAEEERFGGGWIAAIGVREPWRRRGIGEALLLHAFGRLYARGQRRITLGVDAENPTGATRLYERAGMHIAFEAVIYQKHLDL